MDIPTDFIEAQPWPTVLEARLGVAAEPAVYILSQAHKFGRLQGCSPILYIGSTGQLGGKSQSCRLRIYRYPNGRHSFEMQRRTQLVVGTGTDLTLHWKLLDSKTAARLEESRLLNIYLRDHHELPPFNAHA